MNRRKKNKTYHEDLLADLRDDPEYISAYLSAAMADSREAFLIALRDVAEATHGVAKVAKQASVNRENLYRMLSEKGNPRLSSLNSVLDVLGLRFVVENKKIYAEDAEAATYGSFAQIIFDTGFSVPAATSTTLNIVTTSFAGTVQNLTGDPNLPAFEAQEVPIYLLTEEETSNEFCHID